MTDPATLTDAALIAAWNALPCTDSGTSEEHDAIAAEIARR